MATKKQPAPTAPLTITEGIALVPPPVPLVKQRMGLYDVTLESQLIEDALVASGGELTPEIEARFDELLKQGPRAIDGACAILRELSASVKSTYDEERRLYDRKKAFERNLETLKERVRIAVDSPMFNGRVKTPRFTVWTQKAADRLEVEFQAADSSLENLWNVRPELVERTVTYKLKAEVVADLWEEERPAREAHDVIVQQRLEAEAAGRPEDAPPPPEPLESKIPGVIRVADVAGRRFLQVR